MKKGANESTFSAPASNATRQARGKLKLFSNAKRMPAYSSDT